MHDQPTLRHGLCECGCGEPTSIARQTNSEFGHVKGQPVRFKPGHNRRLGPTPWEERDCGYETPCWVWLWSIKSTGYGQAIDSAGRNRNAHCVIWERFRGPIPDGCELDHLCRVHACVNPDHLEPVPHATNMQRGANARLTIIQVREIRASKDSALTLAARYGVARRTIYAVRKGDTWKEI